MKLLAILLSYLAVTSNFNQATLASVIDVRSGIGHDDNAKQERSDDSLMKPNPGEIVEERQWTIVVPAVGLILTTIAAVVSSIIWIKEDRPVG